MKLDFIQSHLFNKINFYKINKGATSDIYISDDKKYFLKKQSNYKNDDCLKREIHILKILNENKITWCPKLLYYDDKLFILNYIGNEISEYNIPNDYLQQINKIKLELNQLNIQHNDIKLEELLIKDNKIYLVDYGWASINNDYSCNNLFKNKMKLGKVFTFDDILDKLELLYNKKKDKLKLLYKRNNTGPLSEKPKIKFNKENIIIDGYQNFIISKNKIIIKKKKNKYNLLFNIILKLSENSKSITDIGCSNGMLCFYSHFIGFNKIYALDYDKEYLHTINLINKKLDIKNIYTKFFSFGDNLVESDIIVMSAIIHWIYSSTALFGSFNKIFKYIKPYIKKYLIIEWIGRGDSAIKNIGHIKINQNIHTQKYCKSNFVNELKKNIGEIIDIHQVENHRYLYVVKKNI